MTTTPQRTYTTLKNGGLRHDILPMRLYHKAKKLGTWDPRDIDLTQDRADWVRLSEQSKDRLLRLILGFQVGEEAVTLDLLPLIMTMAREGRLEEEMFLTTFLWEEAKHTEFFRRVLDETIQEPGDLHHLRTNNNNNDDQSPTGRDLFGEVLPYEMNMLLTDPSPVNQIRASVLYNMIIEGMLAETGYQNFFRALDEASGMPGLRQGLRLIQRDESRHIAYGVFLISRLVAQDKSLWPVVEERMHKLFARVEINQEQTNAPEFLRTYSKQLFQKRLARIKRALDQSPEQVYQSADTEDEPV
jgi:ribonucleoside-diphosphate reductase beta chain